MVHGRNALYYLLPGLAHRLKRGEPVPSNSSVPLRRGSRIAGQEGQAPWAASDARSSSRKKRWRSRGGLGVQCWFDHTTISRLSGRRGCAARSAGLSITRVRSRAVSRRPPCRIVGRPRRKRLWSYPPPRGHRTGKPWRTLTRTRGWLAPRAINSSSPIPGFTEPPRRKPGRFSFSGDLPVEIRRSLGNSETQRRNKRNHEEPRANRYHLTAACRLPPSGSREGRGRRANRRQGR